MLSKRIIPCLDVREGRTTKGIKFKDNVDIGDPVDMARFYYEEGADEIVFYDITASHEKRNIMIEVVRRVAEIIFIPFSVGGGIRTVNDMRSVLLAGAEKVSVNSAAVKDPEIISKGAEAFGSQCIVLGMDVKYVGKKYSIPSGYEIVINGGRIYTGIDALKWAIRAHKPKHLSDVLTKGKADAALIASMVHYGTYSVSEIKSFLDYCGVKVRKKW